MTVKQKKWILLLLLAPLPVLSGCRGCDTAPPPAPSAPSNLTASTVSATRIDLAWTDNSTNEDGFYIYRKSSSYQRIASVGANTTSCTNVNLTPGTTYM